MINKQYLAIILLSVLYSCTTTIFSPSHTEVLKKREQISVQTIMGLSTQKKTPRENKAKILINILNSINTLYYGKAEKIKLVIQKSTKEKFISQANDTILVTTAFIDSYMDKLDESDLFTILCHESAHILNNHWGKTITRDSGYTEIEAGKGSEISTPNSIIDLLNGAFGSQGILTFSSKYSTYEGPEEFSEISPDSLNARLSYIMVLGHNDISIDEEYEADIDSISCLKELNIHHKVSSTIKKSLAIIKNIDKKLMLLRLNRILIIEKTASLNQNQMMHNFIKYYTTPLKE